MADLVSEGKSMLGIGGSDAATASVGGGGTFIVYFILILLVFISIMAVLTYWLIMRKTYKYKIVLFQRIDGRFQVGAKDTARIYRVGAAGDQALYLRKAKKLIPMPTLQTGFNIYWFFISDDGEWINFDPADFDEQRRQLGAHFLDKEMRYARTSLQYMAKERYAAPGFWEKYGGIISYVVLILVTSIGFYLIIDKMVDVANANKEAVMVGKEILEESRKLLGTVDTMRNGGSGLVPAS